jgi:hypothetical protein
MPTSTATETIGQMIKRLATDHVGPDALTKAVLAEIGHDPDRMYQALTEVLPAFCRRAITLGRQIIVDIREEDDTDDTSEPTAKVWVSKKQQRIHDWYTTELAKQFHVEGGYRRLGDCTATDLLYSAEERRQHAAGHLAEASKLEALADALDRYQAQTVADLGPAVLGDILRSA